MAKSPTLESPESRQKAQAIIDGAAHAFCHYGFARTQMVDIAVEAGVALGTLYRYAPSKEALFKMALLAGVGADEAEVSAAGQADDLVGFIEHRLLARINVADEVEASLAACAQSRDPVGDFVGFLFDLVDRVHRALRMLDRSSREWGELASVFNAQVRAPALSALERFIAQLRAQGRLRTHSDDAVQARIILEMLAWFAMHRRFTPDAPQITDAQARAATIDFVRSAVLREP
jgi:AcrR family transcriptional regulator